MKTYYIDGEELIECDDMKEIIDDSERLVKYNDLEKQLKREAKIGRALLWAIEYSIYIANPMNDGQFDEDDLNELMNNYEGVGGK